MKFFQAKYLFRYKIALAVLIMASLSFISEGKVLQEQASIASDECYNPRVAVTDSGDVYCVWEGVYQGRSRIFFRERKNGEWGKELIIDDSEWGDNHEPVITFDSEGAPYVAWSYSDPEFSSVVYAYRRENSWVHPAPLSMNSDLNCESPDIVLDKTTDRVFVTWQEGRGSRYAVYGAYQDDKGLFVTEQISDPDDTGYNVFPQIFMSPSPFVAWYGMHESDFILRAALFNIQAEKWMRYEPSGLENLPCNRLPFLMSDSGGDLHAVWYDSDGSTDRIFFAAPGGPGYGQGRVVDDNPAQINNLPIGEITEDGRAYICWRGESIFGGQIFLNRASQKSGSFHFGESRLISDGQNLFYTEPDLSAGPNGRLACVWISSALDGGDGAVYFRIVNE